MNFLQAGTTWCWTVCLRPLCFGPQFGAWTMAGFVNHLKGSPLNAWRGPTNIYLERYHLMALWALPAGCWATFENFQSCSLNLKRRLSVQIPVYCPVKTMWSYARKCAVCGSLSENALHLPLYHRTHLQALVWLGFLFFNLLQDGWFIILH